MVNQLVSEARTREQAENPRAIPGGNNPPKVHELLITDLQETYKLELAKIEPIAARANDAKQKVEDDDDLKLWSSIYLDADGLLKSLDDARLIEQRPLLAALKTVFGPTLDRLNRITTFAKKISDDYNREKRRKEQEARDAEQKRLREAAEEAARDAQIAAEFGDTEAVIEHAQASAANQAEAARLQTEAPSVADIARVRGDDGGMATAKGEWRFEILDIQKVDLNALRAHFSIKEIEKAIGKAVRATKQHTKIDGVRVYEDVATQFRR